MSKSLSPAVRRQIIAFDPAAAGASSVSEFCRSLGVTRPVFYNIRKRFQAEGNAALNPRSRAPKQPAQVFTADTVAVVVEIRRRLAGKGWDAGPKSVWHTAVDEGLFLGPVPSVSTIARILASTGMVDPNPRKRPRTSYVRFQRAHAMEMWQLDAFEYKLFTTTPASATPATAAVTVTIYQLVDDSTRFDVGTNAHADPENGADAIVTVAAAIDACGVPQELLSDNGMSFNQSRRGSVSELERFLADRGCLAVSGRFYKPTTQGKNERSHQTLQRFLDAHAPQSLQRVCELIGEYRDYYNHRRHHQSLPGEITPGQAWEVAEHHPSDEVPIPHTDLIARALAYRDKAAAAVAAVTPTAVSRTVIAELGVTADPQHTASGRLREHSGRVVIGRTNPQVYLHGKVIKVPTHLVGEYEPVLTDDEYILFDVRDGAEAIRIPLPLTATAVKRTFPLWQVRGARIRDPKPSWLAKHTQHDAAHYRPHQGDQ